MKELTVELSKNGHSILLDTYDDSETANRLYLYLKMFVSNRQLKSFEYNTVDKQRYVLKIDITPLIETWTPDQLITLLSSEDRYYI